MSDGLRLRDADPDLERLLLGAPTPPTSVAPSTISCETVDVTMRDGVRLATDLYLPRALPAPVVARRTPYGRRSAEAGYAAALLALARRGYVVVSQDCRGTGDSEPDSWDYYMFEPEDGYDLVAWITSQEWYGGFIGSFGGSYGGQTQWQMATHPAMSAIVPSMSGLGVAVNTARLHMFVNAYAASVGKGDGRVTVPMTEMEQHFEGETLSGGFFNEALHPPLPETLLETHHHLRERSPSDAKQWLWEQYCAMTCAQRAEFVKQALGVTEVTLLDVESLASIFGQRIAHDAHTLPRPNAADRCRLIQAPALLRTGWYDWGLNDALATWALLRRAAHDHVAARSRLIVTPYAHNMPGYREGGEAHPELQRLPDVSGDVGLLVRWYAAVQAGTTDSWPTVIYYLMGANEWRVASDWPVPEARTVPVYLAGDGALAYRPPPQDAAPDHYTYDPDDPTPTVGGSIVSYVYTPGSADVSGVQRRPDIVTYTTPPLDEDLDVVGPLRMVLYASSSAVDTDFVARLSDVFPDGRAVQLQSGVLRTRHRDVDGGPALLEPGRVYRFDIDMWATANRFKAGHRIRVDIASADFPHYDRNANLGGAPGAPVRACQTIYHDAERPSHLLLPVLRSSQAQLRH